MHQLLPCLPLPLKLIPLNRISAIASAIFLQIKVLLDWFEAEHIIRQQTLINTNSNILFIHTHERLAAASAPV